MKKLTSWLGKKFDDGCKKAKFWLNVIGAILAAVLIVLCVIAIFKAAMWILVGILVVAFGCIIWVFRKPIKWLLFR
jgi:hypothetical protein